MSIRFEVSDSDNKIDPRFLWMEARQEQKDDGEQLIGVIAKINDIEAWKRLQYIKNNSKINLNASDWLITAQVPTNRFKELAQLPFVKSLEMGRPIQPASGK